MKAIRIFRSLELSSRRVDFLTSRHPLAKLIVTFCFLVAVVSTQKYDLSILIPFFFYPVVFLALIEVQPAILASVLGIALFPVIILGLIPLLIMGFTSQKNWIVLFTLMAKVTLTVTATYLLAATTRASDLFTSLRHLHVPKFFCLQLLLTWRYIDLLLEEVERIIRAHSLRANGRIGIEPSLWGPLLGQLLIRSHKRADRVYDAMRLRGFDGEFRIETERLFHFKDLLYCLICIVCFIVLRIFNLPLLIGNFVVGGIA